jgi:hypothetical protein
MRGFLVLLHDFRKLEVRLILVSSFGIEVFNREYR